MLAVIAAIIFAIAGVLALVGQSLEHVLVGFAVGFIFLALHEAFGWRPLTRQ